MQRPNVLPVKPEAVPMQLRERPRWVLWKHVARAKPDGTSVWAKLPVRPDGRPAKSSDPSTWTTFDDACDALILGGGFDGLGFVLGDGLQGIDLDDHRDPDTGELSAFAQEVLARVGGYAEVSPSGTGLKIITPTDLTASRTNHDEGVELYVNGRYFAVTGHVVDEMHVEPARQAQSLGWLVERIRGEADLAPADSDDDAFANLQLPLEDWDADRVSFEILAHLDPNCGYEDWLRVGQALHHQGGGDEEWLALWDAWSEPGSTYAPGVCAEKWRSFGRRKGRGVTLASLLKATKPQRQQAVQAARRSALEALLAQVEATTNAEDLQSQVALQARDEELSDVAREQLATAIQVRARTLGTRLPIATVRQWIRPRPTISREFAHLNDEGHPLCTMENLRALMAQVGCTIRYNVIKKAIEINIPGGAFSRDNRENAAFGYVLNECVKARMSTQHVQQFLIGLADENLYNPVAEWITSSPWDGTSRLEAFYATVKEAPGQHAMKVRLMRKWLLQCIAAAFSPDGIAAQGMLTFVGAQNVGKTTWFKRLAPENLDCIFTGHTLDTRSKDSVFIALTYWIVELGEVDATMRKSDISALKSFVTQPVDKIRRPYAATESQFGRRSVFGASVNDDQYLHDPTGNRRFWTVEAVGFDLDHQIDMQQLWAEVLELWRAGEQYFLTRDDVAELADHNQQFEVVDPIEEQLASAYRWEGVAVWDWVTATEVLIRLGMREPSKGQTIAASRALRKLNGNQRRKSNGRVLFAVPAESNEFLT